MTVGVLNLSTNSSLRFYFYHMDLVDYRRYKGKSAVVSIRDKGTKKFVKKPAAFMRHTNQNGVLYTLWAQERGT